MWKSAIGLQAVWQDFYRLENVRFSWEALKIKSIVKQKWENYFLKDFDQK